jgi:D-alanyl-D-alanine endopeptidase (penicillin-binding protein 7)
MCRPPRIFVCLAALISSYPLAASSQDAPEIHANSRLAIVQLAPFSTKAIDPCSKGPPEYSGHAISVSVEHDERTAAFEAFFGNPTDAASTRLEIYWDISRNPFAKGENGWSGRCSVPAEALPSQSENMKFASGLSSAAALVIDQDRWQWLYAKDPQAQRPIASITKLMTAMVVLDAELPMEASIRILPSDIDRLKGSSSRLKVGSRLRRDQLLKLALMASENRAASALARTYPGGDIAFVRAMNRKARELGMHHSRFVDPTGLNPANVSTAFDLATLVRAAYQYKAIREATTSREDRVAMTWGHRIRNLTFHNSNRLVSNADWDIGLSKTGYIREAGRCLVMQSMINSKPVIIILLDSMKKATRISDANFIRQWLSAPAFSPAQEPPGK